MVPPAITDPASAPAEDSGATRVLLFPLNVVGVPPPSEVEAGAGAVAAELRAYLEEHGVAVEALEPDPARTEWLEAARAYRAEVREEQASLEGAAGVLALRLREGHDFDLLLLPWILMRAARLKDGVVAWDGVRRKVDFFPLGNTKRYRWVLGRVQLWVKVPSLQALGVSAEGEKVFEGAGGLDLVDEAELDLSASKVHLEMVPKDRIFDDRAHLREGIAIALEAFLPRTGARAE